MTVEHKEHFRVLVADACISALGDDPLIEGLANRLADGIREQAWPSLPPSWRNRYLPAVHRIHREGVYYFVVKVLDLKEETLLDLKEFFELLDKAPRKFFVVN